MRHPKQAYRGHQHQPAEQYQTDRREDGPNRDRGPQRNLGCVTHRLGITTALRSKPARLPIDHPPPKVCRDEREVARPEPVTLPQTADRQADRSLGAVCLALRHDLLHLREPPESSEFLYSPEFLYMETYAVMAWM
jgi:hypothetical protein